jgi:hypothetical protein
MADVQDINAWRARKLAQDDIPIGVPPFVLEEPCPGCGTRRISTMVWRRNPSDGRRAPFPRVEPLFFCQEGRVLWQEISDAPIPVSAWSGILGRFEAAEEVSGPVLAPIHPWR